MERVGPTDVESMTVPKVELARAALRRGAGDVMSGREEAFGVALNDVGRCFGGHWLVDEKQLPNCAG